MTKKYSPRRRTTVGVYLWLSLIVSILTTPSSCHAKDSTGSATTGAALRGSSSAAVLESAEFAPTVVENNTNKNTNNSHQPNQQEEAPQDQQQHDDHHHRRLQRPVHPCLLVRVEVEYGVIKANGVIIDETFLEDTSYYNGRGSSGGASSSSSRNNNQDNIVCELLDEDVDMAGQYFVPILGIDEAGLAHVVSGETTLLADGAAFFDGALQIPADAAIEFGTVDENDARKLQRQRRQRRQQQQQQQEQPHRHLERAIGERKVLAVRVIGEDVSTTASSNDIANNIFGTAGDTATMASQFQQCSHGKLEMQPFTGRTTTGVLVQKGVVDITIPNIVNGADRRTIEQAVQIAAKTKVGDLRQFDHVMLCLPPGSSGNKWIAYAYVNSWLSVFNDDWCRMLSTQVHELGHNLGLAHSGAQGISYGDKSGMMGYSYFESDKPLQCYNPAKSFELGWYDDKTVTWDPLTQGTWFGTLVGVVDYKQNNGNGSNYNAVVVKIDRGGNDLYIGYNRKKNVNRGVVSNGNEVTIVEEDSGYSESTFIAGLSTNSVKTFSNFENSGKTLTVKFMETRSNLDEAFVAIYLEDCIYPSCCSGDLCPGKTPIDITAAPVSTPIVITPIPDKEIKDAPLGHPILMEIMPNPKKQRAEYIEIYNPTNKLINLSNYNICVQNGNNAKVCLPITGITWLGMGEFFMLCRDEGFMKKKGLLEKLGGRVCHQDAERKFKINNKKAIISLKLNGAFNVDKIYIKNSKQNVNDVYARQSGCNDKANECWVWTKPAGAEAWDETDDTDTNTRLFAEEAVIEESDYEYDAEEAAIDEVTDDDIYSLYDDDGILSEGGGFDIAIQSLPPIDFGDQEQTYTIGESIGDFVDDFWGNETSPIV